MDLYEQQIQDLERKIKKFEESPDPLLPRSYKLFYELEKDMLEGRLNAWRQGKPLVEGNAGVSEIYRALGATSISFPMIADRAAKKYGRAYKEILERIRFPEKCCERATAGLAMAETGDLPRPHMIFYSGQGCDADRLVRGSLARRLNIPAFYVDVGLNQENEPDLASINYVADQLGEFTEWAERKVPGVKYDEDRLREIQETNAVGINYVREIYQLRKHVPCPIAPTEALGKFVKRPVVFPDIKKANETLRIYRDELGERVARGTGPYPEERLRLIWAGQPPADDVLDPSRVLLERKVAVPEMLHGDPICEFALEMKPHGGVSQYGVVLSPLQEVAESMDRTWWGGTGKRWVDGTLRAARDVGAQGIIHFLMLGCTPMQNLGAMLADKAEKELGIPVLNIEGRKLDRDFMTQERFDEILSTFIDKCFDRAGKPRQ